MKWEEPFIDNNNLNADTTDSPIIDDDIIIGSWKGTTSFLQLDVFNTELCLQDFGCRLCCLFSFDLIRYRPCSNKKDVDELEVKTLLSINIVITRVARYWLLAITVCVCSRRNCENWHGRCSCSKNAIQIMFGEFSNAFLVVATFYRHMSRLSAGITGEWNCGAWQQSCSDQVQSNGCDHITALVIALISAW